MMRILSLVGSSFLVVKGSALAEVSCPAGQYVYGEVSLSAEGVVFRTVQMLQKSGSQNGKPNLVYVPVLRDRIQLEPYALDVAPR